MDGIRRLAAACQPRRGMHGRRPTAVRRYRKRWTIVEFFRVLRPGRLVGGGAQVRPRRQPARILLLQCRRRLPRLEHRLSGDGDSGRFRSRLRFRRRPRNPRSCPARPRSNAGGAGVSNGPRVRGGSRQHRRIQSHKTVVASRIPEALVCLDYLFAVYSNLPSREGGWNVLRVFSG